MVADIDPTDMVAAGQDHRSDNGVLSPGPPQAYPLADHPLERDPVCNELLPAAEAAQRLGIATTSLYDWLAQSNEGVFTIRGQSVTIDYFQGGPKGQGRIRIEVSEVERLLSMMRVMPKPTVVRKKPAKKSVLRHITTKLGRPEDD